MTGSERRGVGIYLELAGLAVVALTQGTLLARVRILGASPNLLLVAVIAWSLWRGLAEGLIWAFVGGVAVDLISGMPLGTSSLALLAACAVARLSTKSGIANQTVVPLLAILLATPAYGWVTLAMQQARGVPVNWIASTVRIVAPELLLNGVAMWLFYTMLRLARGGPGLARG